MKKSQRKGTRNTYRCRDTHSQTQKSHESIKPDTTWQIKVLSGKSKNKQANKVLPKHYETNSMPPPPKYNKLPSNWSCVGHLLLGMELGHKSGLHIWWNLIREHSFSLCKQWSNEDSFWFLDGGIMSTSLSALGPHLTYNAVCPIHMVTVSVSACGHWFCCV